GVDLAHPAERLEMSGEFRPPHRPADAIVALAEGSDNASAQKARTAENRDQGVQIRSHGGRFLRIIRSIERLFRRLPIRHHARAVQPISFLLWANLTSARAVLN